MEKEVVSRTEGGESGRSQLRPRSTSGSEREESHWEPPEFGNSGLPEKGKGPTRGKSLQLQYGKTTEGGTSVGLPGIDGRPDRKRGSWGRHGEYTANRQSAMIGGQAETGQIKRC